MLLIITSAVISIVTLLYLFFSHKNEYWKRKGVKHPKPKLILGNYSDFILQGKTFGQTAAQICEEFPDESYIGAYYGTEPTIILKDPELIKLVMTKDFYYFSSRELKDFTKKETITQNIFSESGDYWKIVRQHLTPIFSSAKMKLMFPLIENCTEVFEKLLEEEIKVQPVQEVRTLIARFTMDCVGTCAFGIDTKAMGKDLENNPFRKIADNIFDSSSARMLKVVVRSICPNIFYGLGFKAFPKEIEEFFWDLITKVFNDRGNKPTTRNDFVDYILQFKSKSRIYGDDIKNMKDTTEKKKISLEVDNDLLVAQCMLFFSAGFETSATTLSFTLYELAKDKAVQDRAIAEVDEYFKQRHGKVYYDCVTKLPFVEACIDEALRMYPVLGVSTRELIEDYTFPDGLKLDKGVRFHIPVDYLHKDPKYFPEPEKFNPERFFMENKNHIIPYTYIPFGEGPRICIGMRFAKMQMLAGVATILKRYTVDLAPNMPLVLEYEPKSLIIKTKSGIHLQFKPRK